jgi:hypothetical protein
MSDVPFLPALAALLLSVCSAAFESNPVRPRDNAVERAASTPTMTFAADWTETATPSLVAGVQDGASAAKSPSPSAT